MKWFVKYLARGWHWLVAMTISQSLLLVLVPAGLLGACVDDGGPDRRGVATIENNLAADGCDLRITIDEVVYAPDVASRTALHAQIHEPQVTVPVHYAPTGRTGQVECGETTFLTLPEISVTLD
jgi:hypothetical protein